ncbi:MAG TPA: malto-oligosyltrehalose trehalohydrolase [Methylomirabilota bacterium]|nr:malto-oligosyltrehalose trehalohydrolase [Methylomirabilota bacterium]
MKTTSARPRRLPVGADVWPGAGHFRVWAPRAARVEVVIESPRPHAVDLDREGGYFVGEIADIDDGALYRYRLDGRPALLPDPASRFQPQGPHGPSRVVDPSRYRWTDAGWRGPTLDGQVLYEMHVGTFTAEGTWAAAARELPALARLGVTVVEVMPVAEFPGRFGWGYDGVALYAPTRLYGEPDDFRRFVDSAHAAGLAVILDVVYNHLGPDGGYHRQFSADYHTDRYDNEWGAAWNFDGPNAGPVREFIVANAGYWIDEYHLDGLRLDATQSIHDASPEHVLAAVVRRVRETGRGRRTLIVAENEPQQAHLVRPADRGGVGIDALWNDDFHHAVRVAATGRKEAYYTDYLGAAQELVSAVKWGFLYQGQRYRWQKKRRGTPALDIPPAALVCYLQNHDQVANSGRGERLHRLTSPGRFRALTALLLLAPQTPLLFQGQEFCASAPWLFFADHAPGLARAVSRGRDQFLAQFPSLGTAETRAGLPEPGDPATFERCKLDLGERERHAGAHALHGDLLRLRREDPVFAGRHRKHLDGAVLAPEAFVIRFFGGAGDRLLLVNLGRDLALDPAPEPLLAPPPDAGWMLVWSSEDPRYGGCGTPPPETDEGWRLPGHAAVVLGSETPRR